MATEMVVVVVVAEAYDVVKGLGSAEPVKAKGTGGGEGLELESEIFQVHNIYTRPRDA